MHPGKQRHGLAKMVTLNMIANERGPSELIFTVGYFVEQMAGVKEIVSRKLLQPGE